MGVTLRAASYLGEGTVTTLKQLVDHVGRICEIDLRFDDAAPRSSAEATSDARVDLVWACGLLTVELQDAGVLDTEIVAAPVFVGQTAAVYHSVLVCRKESAFASLDDTIGARLAINEAESWSGHHGLIAHLASQGRSIEMFGDVLTTGSHLNSVTAVLEGKADFAAVDHTVWDHLGSTAMRDEHAAAPEPPQTSGLLVIGRTVDWPAPPFSLSRSLDPALCRRLTDALTSIAPNDIEGLSRIAPATRSNYDLMRPPQSL